MNALLQLVFKLIRASWLYYLAQFLVTIKFWQSGFSKLFNFDATIAEMSGDGLSPPVLFAILTIFVQLVGSAVVIFGRKWSWLGSGALGVFTIFTIILVHHFWTYTDPVAYNAHLAVFYNHLVLIGGLILSAVAADFKYNRRELFK